MTKATVKVYRGVEYVKNTEGFRITTGPSEIRMFLPEQVTEAELIPTVDVAYDNLALMSYATDLNDHHTGMWLNGNEDMPVPTWFKMLADTWRNDAELRRCYPLDIELAEGFRTRDEQVIARFNERLDHAITTIEVNESEEDVMWALKALMRLMGSAHRSVWINRHMLGNARAEAEAALHAVGYNTSFEGLDPARWMYSITPEWGSSIGDYVNGYITQLTAEEFMLNHVDQFCLRHIGMPVLYYIDTPEPWLGMDAILLREIMYTLVRTWCTTANKYMLAYLTTRPLGDLGCFTQHVALDIPYGYITVAGPVTQSTPGGTNVMVNAECNLSRILFENNMTVDDVVEMFHKYGKGYTHCV